MNDLIFLDETSRLDLKVKLYKICKKYKDKKLKIVDNLGNIYESKFLFFYNFLSNKEFLSSPWRNILIEYFLNFFLKFFLPFSWMKINSPLFAFINTVWFYIY